MKFSFAFPKLILSGMDVGIQTMTTEELVREMKSCEIDQDRLPKTFAPALSEILNIMPCPEDQGHDVGEYEGPNLSEELPEP